MSTVVTFLLIAGILSVDGTVWVSASRTLSARMPPQCSLELCQAAKAGDENNYATLLEKAVKFEAVAFADMLLRDVHCDPEFAYFNGNTPLHRAARRCNPPMTFLLLSYGAYSDYTNSSGRTPLCVAARRGGPNCGGVVKHLAEFGANMKKSCDGQKPRQRAKNPIVRDIIIQNGG